jgi:hypothetical protein
LTQSSGEGDRVKYLLGKLRGVFARPLALCALVAGLAIWNVEPARADTWSFAYTGSGVSAGGTFTGTWTGTFFSITSITGTRNGAPITGLFGTDNYYVAVLGTYIPSLKIQYNTTTGSYTLGWVDWSDNPNLGAFIGYPGGHPVSTEASHPTFSTQDTRDGDVGTLAYGLCDHGSAGCTQVNLTVVPEIQVSAGMSALSIIFLTGLLFRELFSRRRLAQRLPTASSL